MFFWVHTSAKATAVVKFVNAGLHTFSHGGNPTYCNPNPALTLILMWYDPDSTEFCKKK